MAFQVARRAQRARGRAESKQRAGKAAKGQTKGAVRAGGPLWGRAWPEGPPPAPPDKAKREKRSSGLPAPRAAGAEQLPNHQMYRHVGAGRLLSPTDLGVGGAGGGALEASTPFANPQRERDPQPAASARPPIPKAPPEV